MNLPTAGTFLIYGGSFDPPHLAHVRLPELARQAIGAEVLGYVPAARSPLKAHPHGAEVSHRLAMLRLALANAPHSVILADAIDHAEADRPSYTIDTLQRLRGRIGGSVKMRLLIGADQLQDFDRWHQPQRLIELAQPLVILRGADRHELLASLPTGFDADLWQERLLDLPMMDISSTLIRRKVARGESITDLVPSAVAQYIHEHRLYRAD